MKKFILSIALAALSFGAHATGSYGVSTGASARVGGNVSAYSGPGNGYASSGVSMRSSANAFSVGSGYGYSHDIGHYDRYWCRTYYSQTGIGSHTGASVSGGADIDVSGSSYGAAGGYNFALGEYDASVDRTAGRDYFGLSTSAASSASTNGWAFGDVLVDGNQSGSVKQSVESGAYNYSNSHADYEAYGRHLAGDVGVDGRTYGKTWAFSDGSRSQSAPGVAWGDSGANSYQSGSAASSGSTWYYGPASADGNVALSGQTHAYSRNNNVGGSWAYGSLGYDASARKTWYSSTADASDWKVLKTDSWGNLAYPGRGRGESIIDGSVEATGSAGNVVD